MLRLMIPGAAALTLLAGASFASADDGDDAVIPEVVLDDSQWQPLPLGIRIAFADPAGRIWLQDGRGSTDWDLKQLQHHIADQFDREMPVIRNAYLALFEPGGRVWFISYQLHLVLGYDGETWIIHSTVDRENRVYGRCQTRGALVNADAHLYAGNAVWLRGMRGVYRFARGEWSYQVMAGERIRYGGNVRLSVEPQGKLAVAWTPGSKDVWLFHNSKWTQQSVPVFTQIPALTELLAVSPESFLYVDQNRRLQRASVLADSSVKLESPDGTDAGFSGKVQVSKIQNLYSDESGRIYVVADDVRGGDSDATSIEESSYPGGLVIMEPGGKVAALRDRELVAAFGRVASSLPAGILTADGSRVWLRQRSGRGRPFLFDLSTRKRLNEIPHVGFRTLHAVDRLGRVFVSASNPGSFSHPVMVWSTNGRPNPRLTVETHDIGPGPVTVTGDGTVWATDPDGQLICYTSGEWQTLPEAPFENSSTVRIESLIPGHGGMVLAQSRDRAALCQPGCVIDSGDLFRVIEDQMDCLCRAFGPDKPQPEQKQVLQIVAARDGRIWCLHQRALRVLDGDLWYDATDALLAAGSRHGTTSVLAPIGDGRRVFITDLSLRHDGGRSFFGTFKDGELYFANAPHVLSSSGTSTYSLRGMDGALWIASTQGRANRTSDAITGQEALRILTAKTDVSLVNSGHAQLLDRAGNIWLSRIRSQGADHVNLWRGGRINQQLHIPGFTGGLLISDGPGSVYARTKIGLQHLVATDRQCCTYQTDTLYDLSWLATEPHYQAFSCQGFVVFATRTPDGSHLHLIDLPR